ncbi:DUF1479 family protein [Candidatus Parcubacteria bacterium]|nr:MAG: DUF1479 family protein [Candidatus Parcubacteria bacterium]
MKRWTSLNQIQEKGYLVYKNVVPKSLLDAVIEDIHKMKFFPYATDQMGMMELYHTQAMWNVRQHPAIHKIFSDLFQISKLWTSIDRVSCKEKSEFSLGGFIHWDICPNKNPRVLEFQGVLALTDTDEDMGGFHCVPSLYQGLQEWLDELPTKKAVFSYFNVDKDEAVEVISSTFPYKKPKRWQIEKVPVKAGDLIIWDSYLPHGNGVNKTDKPRLAQYITMFPVGDLRLKHERVDCWKESKPPSGFAFPGNPYLLVQEKPAELTRLGKRLLGLYKWE